MSVQTHMAQIFMYMSTTFQPFPVSFFVLWFSLMHLWYLLSQFLVRGHWVHILALKVLCNVVLHKLDLWYDEPIQYARTNSTLNALVWQLSLNFSVCYSYCREALIVSADLY